MQTPRRRSFNNHHWRSQAVRLRFVGRLMPKPRAPDEAEAPGQITDQSQSKAVH